MFNNDWLSKQIGINAINQFLEENDKDMPGVDITLLQRSDGKFAFINREGQNIFNKWYEDAHNFVNGTAFVEYKDGKKSEYGYIDTKGIIRESRYDKYKCDREQVYDGGEDYHYVDRSGKQIGGTYKLSKNAPSGFEDNFAIVEKKYFNLAILDKDGNEISQERGDKVIAKGYLGYGYYLTGDEHKVRGIKLKDANTGITLDRFQDAYELNVTYPIGPIKQFLFKKSKKGLPRIEDYWYIYKEIQKENGILLFGNYWFLGSTNLKVNTNGNMYHSKCKFGEFNTKLPPIKAIDSNYLFCAHNNAIYVYDKKNNTYGKTCTREEVDEMLRKRNARKAYRRTANSLVAYKNYLKLNPNDSVKIRLPLSSIICSPAIKDDSKGSYLLQPIITEYPTIFKVATYDGGIATMYQGKRVSLQDAIADLVKKPPKGNINDLIEKETHERSL